MTTVKKIRMIEEVIEREIRPKLRKDGGDIELVDVEGDTVYIALRGMCANCQMAEFTLREVVEKPLREFVSPSLQVREAGS